MIFVMEEDIVLRMKDVYVILRGRVFDQRMNSLTSVSVRVICRSGTPGDTSTFDFPVQITSSEGKFDISGDTQMKL